MWLRVEMRMPITIVLPLVPISDHDGAEDEGAGVSVRSGVQPRED
jgi:hypothetical protein